MQGCIGHKLLGNSLDPLRHPNALATYHIIIVFLLRSLTMPIFHEECPFFILFPPLHILQYSITDDKLGCR